MSKNKKTKKSKFLSAVDVAEYLEVTKRTVHRMINDGALPDRIKIHKREVWRAEDIEKWLEDKSKGSDEGTITIPKTIDGLVDAVQIIIGEEKASDIINKIASDGREIEIRRDYKKMESGIGHDKSVLMLAKFYHLSEKEIESIVNGN